MQNLNYKSRTILFLSSRLPFPPVGGGRLRNYWLLKILSRHFKVHLVSIAEEEVPEDFYRWAEELGISFKIFRKTKKDFYLNVLKGLLNNLPLQVNYYYFKDVQDYIDSIYQNFDLLFVTLIRTAKYVIDKNKHKIFDMVDSISLNYKRSKKKTKSIFWKLVYHIESRKLLQFERYCIEKFDKTLFVNREEEEFYNAPLKTAWIPNGVSKNLLVYNKYVPRWKNSVVFFGKMDYQPNIDAVLWFVENVLPNLDENLQFVVVGAYPSKSLKKLEKKYSNLKILGYMEDPYIILKSALCVIAPMQTGGGIQNKVLESMALGTINIVSSLAAKPIGAEDGKHFLVCDDPERMVELIRDIARNPSKYEHIKKNAREFIKHNFTWSIYEEKLLEIIDSVLK